MAVKIQKHVNQRPILIIQWRDSMTRFTISMWSIMTMDTERRVNFSKTCSTFKEAKWERNFHFLFITIKKTASSWIFLILIILWKTLAEGKNSLRTRLSIHPTMHLIYSITTIPIYDATCNNQDIFLTGYNSISKLTWIYPKGLSLT